MAVDRLGMRGVVGRFYSRLDSVLATGWQNDVAWLSPSNQKSEEYAWLGATPAVREWVGGRQAQSLRENGLTIVNKRFESTIGLDVDDQRRDKSGQAAVRIGEMAERVAEHWHSLLSTQITTASTPAYDGQNFYSASHSEGASGTQTNLLTASDIPSLGEPATAAAPTTAQMSAAILDVIGHMRGYVDDQGEPMNSNGTGWAVVVPTGLWGATEGALRLPLIADGSGTTNNILTSLSGWNLRTIVNPRLSSGTEFYIFRTDASGKAFIMQEELFETSSKDETFDQRRILFGVTALRNVGTAYWQYSAKATLS